MPISHLQISHFRNLSSVVLQPSENLNVIYGSNGSGKTSLLEAISVLAHGRSFRTRKFRRLIQSDRDDLTVFGRVSGGDELSTAIGVSRHRSGESQFKLAGVAAKSAAQLAAHLPVLVLNSDSFGLLVGSPKQRRQFFDWLVFHVKQSFQQTWSAYSRSVKQRNSLLRRDKMTYAEVKPWDLEISRLSRQIEVDRRACIEPFLREFRSLTSELGDGIPHGVAVDYINGWKSEAPFEEQLAEVFPRDRKLGYTSMGPHKSDLRIMVGNVPAGELLSRGQQKTMIAALYIAEARTFGIAQDRTPVFLIDDMPAELDRDNIGRVGSWLKETRAQLFVTCVDRQPVFEAWPDIQQFSPSVFHVEQGRVTIS